MADADKLRDADPWHPMADAVDVKTIGKFLEELGETVSAAARALIQGIDECEPVTGKPNRKWLEDELADLRTNMDLVTERFALQIDEERVARKRRHLQQWHNLA
jgi:hypothetical protein